MEGEETEGSIEGERTQAEWVLTRVPHPDVVFVGTVMGSAWAMAGRSDVAVVPRRVQASHIHPRYGPDMRTSGQFGCVGRICEAQLGHIFGVFKLIERVC